MKNNTDKLQAMTDLATKLYDPRLKNILILGAGTSHEAANLPLGPELASIMKSIFDCNEGQAHFQKYMNHIAFLNKKYGFIPEDFKTIFFALNHIDEKKLLRITNTYLNEYEIKDNTYAIIAKLFHQQHLHHIVNFNFDEILEFELKKYKRFFNYITPNKSKFISDASDLQSFIKPHGTINDVDSLRFRRKDYYKIEDNVLSKLKSIMDQEPINLIISGFRLKFHDINTKILTWLHQDSTIIVFDKNEDCLDEKIREKYNCIFYLVDENNSLNHSFNMLSNQLELKSKSQQFEKKILK